MLKRKNEDLLGDDPLTKRVAIDADMLEAEEAQKDKNQTAPLLNQPAGDGAQDSAQDSAPDSVAENATGSESAHASDLPKRLTPISSHKVHDDPTYVHFRMLVPVKEAALIVGKGGEKINYIKEKSGARINVSENIKGIYERVVHVRGPAEKVAKAFGLITRAIIDEPETPSSPDSKQYVLKLLIPHPVIGFVIGKGGQKFREIEEKSAAKLKASESTMAFSTDRCLLISGVPDAIHIATYYVGQTIYENKKMHKTKIIFYNPGNSGYGVGNVPGSPAGAFPGAPQFPGVANLANFQFTGFNANGFNPQMMGMMPMHMNYMGNVGRHNGGMPGARNLKPYAALGNPGQMGNNRVMSLPPSQHNNISTAPNTPPVGSIQPPPTLIPVGSPQQTVTQDIYIANEHVGLVIGKGGKNIREVRDSSGSQIKVQDPDPNNPNERKIVLIGGINNNQMAMYLINNRIETDKQKNYQNHNNHNNYNNHNNHNNNGQSHDNSGNVQAGNA